MKWIAFLPGIVFLLTFTPNRGFAQDTTEKEKGGLFGKLKKALSAADPNAWRPGSAISTSIKDSLNSIRWLSEADFRPELAEPLTTFDCKPGFYRGKIRSYCLHAGAYSPTKGSGYQISHLKGARAQLIGSILSRSPQHPQIVQHDVQRLIWGIEAGAKFSSYPLDYQLRIKPLLTEKDIAIMEVNVNGISNALMPAKVKDLVNRYSDLRAVLYSKQSSYEDIERIAVKTGIPLPEPGSKEIREGTWSYIGNGFFLRASPQGYSTTEIELYRPGFLQVQRDQQQTIRSFSRDGLTISIEYNDSTGADVYHSKGHPDVPVWRLKTITFIGRESGQKYVISNKGMALRGSAQTLNSIFAISSTTSPSSGPSILRAAPAAHGPNADPSHGDGVQFDLNNPETEPSTFDRLYESFKSYREWYKEFKEGYEWWKRIDEADKVKPPDEYFDQAAVNKQISDGIKAASKPTDFSKKMGWIEELLKMNRDLVYYSICSLEGNCDKNNNPQRPNLPDHPAQPGNSHMQRLGLSPYIQ